MARKSKLCLCLIVLICLCFVMPVSVVKAYATVDSTAKSMCLMEASSRRVLRAKNEHIQRPMASTTKIMTCITAIENAKDFDTKFEVSKEAIGTPGTSLYLREGESLSLRDLLYGLMLVSGNDASVAIGVRVAGNVEFFVDLMNQTAKKIGAKNSHFENTHGLDEKGHYTTAYDLALISSYAMQNPMFKEIVGTKNIKITTAQGKDRYLQNKNKLLRNYMGANGVKTGFTDDAGRCFVGSAEKNGMLLVCSELSCGPMFEECESLLDEGFANYQMVEITKEVAFPRKVSIVDGKQDYAVIVPDGKCCYPLTLEEKKRLKYEFCFPSEITPPKTKGGEIGNIKIFFDNDLLFSLKFTTMDNVETKGVLERFFDILNRW